MLHIVPPLLNEFCSASRIVVLCVFDYEMDKSIKYKRVTFVVIKEDCGVWVNEAAGGFR